jgi:hypothetical protein
MRGININRLIAGGISAGILVWFCEGAASLLYMDDMTRVMAAHGLSMTMDASMYFLVVIVSLLVGLSLVYFYAACRPRFGPGPKTAFIVAVALWVAGYLVSLIGYQMLHLFPPRMLVLWGSIGLIEMVLAAQLGAWIYREP